MKNIKQITALKTFPVRHPVLRAKKPIESCHFDRDTLEFTVHSELYDSDNLLGEVSFFEAKNDSFTIEIQFQIRKISVLTALKKRFGRKTDYSC